MSKNKQVKKCIILYVEGQTEVEFYNKVKEYMKTKLPKKKFEVDQFEVICTKSINQFKKKLLLKFEKEIMSKYNKKDEVIVGLCYDSDGYEFGFHPAIDRNKLEKELNEKGASKVIHLVAHKTIEDWIMLDEKGVLRYLGLPLNTAIKGKNGLEQLQLLFKKKNRPYLKGTKVEGLLDALDFNLICSKLCCELSLLCCEVGIKCSKDIMKS